MNLSTTVKWVDDINLYIIPNLLLFKWVNIEKL